VDTFHNVDKIFDLVKCVSVFVSMFQRIVLSCGQQKANLWRSLW